MRSCAIGVIPFIGPVGPRPRSHLCVRCRDAGVIAEADLASVDSCRGHLAEDRVNVLIKEAGL